MNITSRVYMLLLYGTISCNRVKLYSLFELFIKFFLSPKSFNCSSSNSHSAFKGYTSFMSVYYVCQKNSRNDKCFTLTFDIHQSSKPMLYLDISCSVVEV